MLSKAAQRDIGTLLHPYTHLSAIRRRGPLVFERGKGVYVFDSEGKERFLRSVRGELVNAEPAPQR